MLELYEYMKEKLQEMYTELDFAVTIDRDHFFMLYRIICDMLHIGNVIREQDSTLAAVVEGKKKYG